MSARVSNNYDIYFILRSENAWRLKATDTATDSDTVSHWQAIISS